MLSPDEIERILADHRLYMETEYHQGHRANFSSADLTERDFSGLNLRRIKCLPLKDLARIEFPVAIAAACGASWR
jgi:hypothetical protein